MYSKRIPIESVEQEKLVYWLRIKHIFHWATTNENNTYGQNRKYAMIAENNAKRGGKLKGVSDLTVMLPHIILYIELKRQPKVLKSGKKSTSHTKTSKEQLDFIEEVNKYPYAKGKVCYGFEEARAYIEENMV